MGKSLLRRLVLAASVAAACLAPAGASAKPHTADPATAKRAKASSTTEGRARASDADSDRAKKRRGAMSFGAPNRGHLEGSVRLKPTSHLKVRPGAHTWALPALTKALHHAADRVASKHKGSVLLVGDLSARGGGALEGHNSHQSGRDADVGFFVANTKGKPANVRRFLAFDGDGTSKDIAWARFDDARNWMLVEELLKDERANVRYVFVSNALRGRLLKYAAAKKVSKDMIARASAALMTPEHADLHDDHFHVRIACPESMRSECVEESGAREGTAAPSDAQAGTAPGADAPAAPTEPAAPAASSDPY